MTIEQEYRELISRYYGTKEARADHDRNRPNNRIRRERHEKFMTHVAQVVTIIAEATLIFAMFAMFILLLGFSQ